MNKFCKFCKIDHPNTEEFFAFKGRKYGRCRVAIKSDSDRRYREKKAELLRKNQNYYFENQEKLCEYQKQYREAHREELNTKSRLRRAGRKGILQIRIANRLRSRFYRAVRTGKSASAVRDLGCSIEEFIKYIERQFQVGMTWENWSRTGWHLDHKKPLASFDLTDVAQAKEACHYTNIQPLWARHNLVKGARV